MCFKFFRRKNPKDSLIDSNTPQNRNHDVLEKKTNDYVVEEALVVSEKKDKVQKYHVSQNKNQDAENFMKWRVRKESSKKTIHFFDTQRQAIDYAQGLADRAGSTVVIHKLDGTIRKQDYKKKA